MGYMADWSSIDPSGNVEDRRSSTGLMIGGGTALVGIILYVALNYLGIAVDPTTITDTLSTINSSPTQTESGAYAGQDDYQLFTEKVLGSTNAYWRTELTANSTQFRDPKLVLYRGNTQTGCGMGSASVGPFYCPSDESIYLDETFFDTLKQLGGSTSDSAQAYVIAHEAGHYAQKLLGIMSQVEQDPNYQRTGMNSLSVRLELQADCFAGLWANSLKNKNVFNAADITNILTTTESVGDDRIQSQTEGQITPETWTHGSSKERLDAFKTGYASGHISACPL